MTGLRELPRSLKISKPTLTFKTSIMKIAAWELHLAFSVWRRTTTSFQADSKRHGCGRVKQDTCFPVTGGIEGKWKTIPTRPPGSRLLLDVRRKSFDGREDKKKGSGIFATFLASSAQTTRTHLIGYTPPSFHPIQSSSFQTPLDLRHLPTDVLAKGTVFQAVSL